MNEGARPSELTPSETYAPVPLEVGRACRANAAPYTERRQDLAMAHAIISLAASGQEKSRLSPNGTTQIGYPVIHLNGQYGVKPARLAGFDSSYKMLMMKYSIKPYSSAGSDMATGLDPEEGEGNADRYIPY